MFEESLSAGLNPDQKTTMYAAGTVVRVTQQIPRHDDTLAIVVEGKVLRQERQGSGSWFARNRGNKVWLDRLVIEKTDGEVSILNLDEYSRVEVVSGEAGVAGVVPMVVPGQDRSASIT